MHHQMLNQPPLPLVARRSTKRHIHEFMVHFERDRASCERAGRGDEAVSLFDLRDEAAMDTLCCHAFRGRSSMDITEEDILEALRREAGMLGTVPLLLEFKIAMRDVARMQPGLSVEERVHEVEMGVADLINRNVWRQAVRQRLTFVPRYGRLVVEAVLEGIWPGEFRDRVVSEARFREISGDPYLLYDLLEEMLPIQTAREEECWIMQHGRIGSGGSGSFYHASGNGGHREHRNGTCGVSDGLTHGNVWGGDWGSNASGAPGGVYGRSWLRRTPGSGHGGTWLWRGSGGGSSGGFNHGGALGGNRGENHKGDPGNGNGGSCSWRSQDVDGGNGSIVGGSRRQGASHGNGDPIGGESGGQIDGGRGNGGGSHGGASDNSGSDGGPIGGEAGAKSVAAVATGNSGGSHGRVSDNSSFGGGPIGGESGGQVGGGRGNGGRDHGGASDNNGSEKPYREAIGGLMWIANATRSDISNVIREVARQAHDPSETSPRAVLLKVVEYLKGTRDKGITYKKSPSSRLTAYADSSFAENKQNRRSVSGGVAFLAGGAISWFSRTQHCVTLNTTEIEYVVLPDVAREEVVSLRGLLEFLLPGLQRGAVTLLEDNHGAVKLAKSHLH